jgi:hypothetical protein
MNSNFFNFSQRKKRDILFDLLVGKSSEGIVSKKELNAVNRLLEGPPSFKTPVITNNRPTKTEMLTVAGKNATKTKRKTTCYLSQEISENLDKVQMTVHSLVSADIRARVSRSYIVAQALAVTLQEFDAQGKDSRLVRFILQNT